MATILVTSRSFGSGDRDLRAELERDGHVVVTGPSDHRDLDQSLAIADAWIAGTGPVTADHLDSAQSMKVVARYGVGVEAVDLEAAQERGVLVTNTPGANSDAVADHAVGLMLAALRGVAAGDRRVRQGDWSVRRGRQLGSLTVGILGFGRIGQGVARRLSGFGCPLVVSDPYVADEVLAEFGATRVSADQIGAAADLVTLHAPGGIRVVDEAWLATARSTRESGERTPLILINTARADLVDEQALAEALADGWVAGYAADTLEGDTAADASPLLARELDERVTITAHLGAQTVEAVDGMGVGAVTNVLAVLAGEVPPNLVTPTPR